MCLLAWCVQLVSEAMGIADGNGSLSARGAQRPAAGMMDIIAGEGRTSQTNNSPLLEELPAL